MFNKATIVYNPSADIYSVSGFFGMNFKTQIIKLIGVNKFDALFIKFGYTGFSYYSFFNLEVYRVLEKLISRSSVYGVNVSTVKSYLEYMDSKNTELINDAPKLDLDIIPKLMKYEILEAQEKVFVEYEKIKTKLGHRGLLLDMAPGTGKELHIDTPVKIPGGWKCIGDLLAGETVIGRDGKPTTVTGVYHQGIKQLYKVVFEDGRYVKAGLEHLWSTYVTMSDNYVQERSKTITLKTEDIINGLNKQENQYYIDLPEPEVTEKNMLPIDPYNLGVILSAGVLGVNYTWIGRRDIDIIKNMSDSIRDTIDVNYNSGSGYEITKGMYVSTEPTYFEHLDSLGLRGIRNGDKFIPAVYLNSSIEQRWSLLQGILDAGTNTPCDDHTCVMYRSVSTRLAEDLAYLVRSLGGKAKIEKIITTSNRGSECHSVHIQHPTPYKLFSIAKHNEIIPDDVNVMKLKISTIEKVEKAQAVCITVDNSDKLYVVKDFIVTHNTFTGLALAEALHAERIVIIVPSYVAETVWAKALNDEVYKEKQDFYLVNNRTTYSDQRHILCTYENLDKLKEITKFLKGYKSVVLIDESHSFGDSKTLRTSLLLEVIDEIDSSDNIPGSGTPLKEGVKELAVLFKILDKRFKDNIEKRFYGLYKNPGNVFKDILQERYGHYSVNVTKEGIGEKPITQDIIVKLEDSERYTLPHIAITLRKYVSERMSEITANLVTYENKYIELYNRAKIYGINDGVKESLYTEYEDSVKLVRKYYERRQLGFYGKLLASVNHFEKFYIATYLSKEDKKQFMDVKTIYKYPALKVQGEALANIILRTRIECHKAMAEKIQYEDILESTTAKTVIFSSYVEVCDAVMRQSVKLGYSPLGVYGNTTGDLTKIVDTWSKVLKYNPLVATLKSLSTGNPLIAANIALFIDLPFRMYTYEQAISRLWRLGQKLQVYIYVAKLDTGNVKNINGRNVDIIDFFRKEVEAITGHASEIEILAKDDVTSLSVEDMLLGYPYFTNDSESLNLYNAW